MVGSKWLLAGLAAAAIATGTAQAAEPFYAGKTLNLIVGLAAGGSSDLTCRLIAQYLPKYIPGDPTIIVKNMPSTDSIVALNYVGTEAKPDGLTGLCGANGLDNQILHIQGYKADVRKFMIASGYGGAEVMYIRADVAPGVKTGADLFKAKGLVLGAYAVNALKDMTMRTFLETAGITDYRYVTGFTGDAQARASVQQKFINLYQENMATYVQVTVPNLVKDGTVIPIYQTGLLDANDQLNLRDPRLPDLPTYNEFYQARYGKPPSGSAYDLGRLILAEQDVSRAILALSPGSPQTALDTLSAAIAPLNADPDFISAFHKLQGDGSKLQPADVVAKNVHNFLDMPAATLQVYNDLIKSGQAIAQNNGGKGKE